MMSDQLKHGQTNERNESSDVPDVQKTWPTAGQIWQRCFPRRHLKDFFLASLFFPPSSPPNSTGHRAPGISKRLQEKFLLQVGGFFGEEAGKRGGGGGGGGGGGKRGCWKILRMPIPMAHLKHSFRSPLHCHDALKGSRAKIPNTKVSNSCAWIFLPKCKRWATFGPGDPNLGVRKPHQE